MGAASGTAHPGPHASPGYRSRILWAEAGPRPQHQVRAAAQVTSICAPYSGQNWGKAPARVCPQGRKLGCILCSMPHQHSVSCQVLLSLARHLLKQCSLFHTTHGHHHHGPGLLQPSRQSPPPQFPLFLVHPPLSSPQDFPQQKPPQLPCLDSPSYLLLSTSLLSPLAPYLSTPCLIPNIPEF